ncbi:MAG: hemerythrin domain-containing protein [Myxococcales bacterium]|nr:hemerythrin domain-containing protein [Myxococcales bacterium]
MPRTAATPHEDSLYTFMTSDHARLETVFERLLDAMELGAPDARALWTELDRGLLSHLEAEERYVLPAFATVDRLAAREILRDHAQIREQLLELGVAMDLHMLRYEHSQEFIRVLRSHAAREDKLLYQWADTRLDAHLRAAARQHAVAH